MFSSGIKIKMEEMARRFLNLVATANSPSPATIAKDDKRAPAEAGTLHSCFASAPDIG